MCCGPWGCKESDTNERLNWTDWLEDTEFISLHEVPAVNLGNRNRAVQWPGQGCLCPLGNGPRVDTALNWATWNPTACHDCEVEAHRLGAWGLFRPIKKSFHQKTPRIDSSSPMCFSQKERKGKERPAFTRTLDRSLNSTEGKFWETNTFQQARSCYQTLLKL